MTNNPLRVAVGGFQHETNTFAPVPASLAAFEHADAWPGLVHGDGLGAAVAGYNLPLTGFLTHAAREGWKCLPTLWCSATPSGPVTREAFEHIATRLLDGLDRAAPFDAIYLDLHGAMVAEHLDDGEGELLSRIRARFGHRMPLVASLDLHANLSARMVEQASALVAYRTYPHVDMIRTGARAAALLARVARHGPPAAAWRQFPFLIPLGAQLTDRAPLGTLIEIAEAAERDGAWSVSVTPGFPCADIADCGPAALAYADDAPRAQAIADRLANQALADERHFAQHLVTPAAAIEEARAIRRRPGGRGPVILADTQDNPGAGGTGDTVGIIAALVEHQVEDAVVAMLHDPRAAAAAHGAGIGRKLELAIGAAHGIGGEQPVAGPWTVTALGDGELVGSGPFYHGCRMSLGAMAVLTRGGVRVVVSSRNQQAADQAMLRAVGIEPAATALLALKSSVHFRADFAPIARAILTVASPGAAPADPGALAFRRLRPGVRRRPGGRPEDLPAVAGGD